MNECDGCNDFLANEYESHLAFWSQFARSITQVKGKNGAPDYENPSGSMKIANSGGHRSIYLTDKTLFEKAFSADGPFSFSLPMDATSPKFVPLRAAKALIKFACSICPLNELAQCEPAIDWLMNRITLKVEHLPVLIGFTPGPAEAFTSQAVLLRRKKIAQEPYFWLVIQYLNHRLQTLVPACPIDASQITKGAMRLTP
jgi:hypothetical protein